MTSRQRNARKSAERRPGRSKPTGEVERGHRYGALRVSCETFAISRSSRTSTTASRRSPTASSSGAAACRSAEMGEQVLDSMDLERERGITIKAQTVALSYDARDGQTYSLHLIDTPGHVDFAYEVSRSLAACEGALLVVDASQGVEAQTVANCYTAIEQGVDGGAGAEQDRSCRPPIRSASSARSRISSASMPATRCASAPRPARACDDVLEAVIARIPPPRGDTGRSAAGAHHRFLVRQLRRRGDAGAGDGGQRSSPGTASC